MSDDAPPPIPTLPKPDELLAMSSVAAELFTILRDWFKVPPKVALDLTEIDSAVVELGDPQMIAAMAMRKLQALHLLSRPGVKTATDVVVTIVNDLERALVQAPSMRLKLRAAATDWDAELARLGETIDGDAPAAPIDAAEIDPEVERFAELHLAIHQAVRAVLRDSEGGIRYFI